MGVDKPAPPPVHAGFCERVFFNELDLNLRSGLPMKVVMNGEVVPEERERRIVGIARLFVRILPLRGRYVLISRSSAVFRASSAASFFLRSAISLLIARNSVSDFLLTKYSEPSCATMYSSSWLLRTLRYGLPHTAPSRYSSLPVVGLRLASSHFPSETAMMLARSYETRERLAKCSMNLCALR
jgi:hypothetical protein